MAKRVNPYYSKRRKFYHVYRQCSVGRQIEKHNRRQGKEGRKYCGICKLIARGKRNK